MQPPDLRLVFLPKHLTMKTIVIFACLFLMLEGGALAQLSETRSVAAFSGIKASEGIDVYLKKGAKEELKVEVSGAKLSDVITEVSGSYLKIHMREGRYRDRTVKVYVTYASLGKLSASSAANIFHTGILKASSLELTTSSAGNIELQVDCGELESNASSAGQVEVEGKARVARYDASSAGQIDAYDLVAEDVSAEASSAGSVKLSVTKSLEANASSGGSIRYRGNPDQSNTNASSGGSVRKSN
jgi:hypothetical protein